MLTEEKMKQLDIEVSQRSKGLNPDVEPVSEEADSYAFTPEAAQPVTPIPEEYKPEAQNTVPDVYDDDEYITGPKKIEPNYAALKVVAATDRFADNVKKTNIWKRYTYNKDEVLREARSISIETGIPEEAILYSPQTLDNARNVYNYRRRQMALMDPGTDEVSLDVLTKAYPGLQNIINGDSTVDAAIALQNIQNVRQVNGFVDAARTRWQAGWMRHEMDKIGMKAFMENRPVSEKEFAQYDKIQKQIEELRETPSFFEDPALSIIGGTAEQLPQQLRGVGTGTVYGAALGVTAAGAAAVAAVPTGGASLAALGVAAKTGFSWGMRIGYASDMWQDSAGQRYIEYSRFTDKNGKRVLTDAEARAYAAAAAAVETGIEFMNAGKIIDVLKGNKSAAARQIEAAVAGATDQATFMAALKRVLSGATEVAVSETLEEGGQEAADRVLSTLVSSYKGGNIPKYTPGQVLEGAIENMAAALPATLGFGFMAAGGGSFGLVRKAAQIAELRDLGIKEQMKNITGIHMLQDMVKDTGVKDFFHKDADIAKKVLHDTVEGTGYEKVNIDTQMVLQQEGGLTALRDIAQAAGMSADEIQNAVETGADITVPTEVYFQAAAGNENFAIGTNFISFSDTAPSFARNAYYAQMQKAEMDSVLAGIDMRQAEQQQKVIDDIVQRDFAPGLEQDAAASILVMRPDKPLEGWQDMRNMVKQQLDDMLAPVIRDLKKGMKQGVDIIRVEGDRDSRYVKQSNNAEWARKFYAENKRWPTQFELEGMAIDILSGRDFSKLPDYQNRPEMQEFYDANEAQIQDLLDSLDMFDNIKEKIAAINPDDLQALEGMSKEAADVYRQMVGEMTRNAPNDAVRLSARAGAALLARHADRVAEAMRAAGKTNYTAQDYFREKFGLRMGGTFQGGNSNTVFQVSPEEFNRQKEAVRKQYEGTDGWMKAPNGKDTNLTEDQWITVRTPAFKNWFGDWENNPQNASKIVDENGEPRPFYHGTQRMDRVGDTFLPERATSGPMAFFTSSKEIATNYSKDKIDTSLQREASEYKDQFTVTLPDGKKVNIVDYWNHLSTKEKNAIRKAAGHVTFDDEADNIISDPNVTYGVGDLEYKIKNSNGNVLQALVDEWLTDGNIWGSEEKFLEVLKLAGVKAEVEYLDPKKVVSGVFDVYLNIRNPFNTNNIDEQFINDLEEASKTAKEYEGNVSDMWDKGRQTPAQFVERVKSDYEAGTTHAWTSIPDWVTDMLKTKGYDGILDKGGKNGGQIHDVAIPFASNQIKDASGQNVGFDPESGNIYLQTSAQLDTNYPNWLKDQTTNTGQHSTQIAGTKSTYQKIGNFLKENGMGNATILDASSGLGYGTQALRDAGFNVEDVEPYPSENREAPTYTNYADIPKQYDVVISNAVLNVIPDDWRANVLHSMANAVKTGGRMIINVRDAQEIIKSKQKIELDSSSEVLITDAKGEKIRAYQKGFTQKELVDWVRSELGEGWDVQNATKKNSGLSGARAVVVIKTAEAPQTFFQRQQRQGDTIQGATEFAEDGRRIVSVFNSGNESTMAHEMGHVFLADLKELAEMQNAPEQVKKDWETVKKWLGWKPGQQKFTTKQQEQFARGFEAYLRTGEAPATGLKKIFRDFKKWLTRIYKDFLQLGGKPSEDIRQVMGRMLATDEEVEQAFKLRQAEAFEKAGGFDFLAKDSMEMYQRWQREATEYAKEKVLAQAIKDLKKQRAEEMSLLRDQMADDFRAELAEKPLYQAELLLSQNPKMADALPDAVGMTYEEYTQAIAEQGTLEQATQKAVDAAMKEVEEGLPMEDIKQQAEAAVDSSEYRGLYLAFEHDFIEKKMRQANTLDRKILQILDDLEKAAYDANIETVDPEGKLREGEPKEDSPLQKKIKELKYQARWNEAEMKAINRMERAEDKAELQRAVKEFKAIFRRTRQNVRVYRDTAVTKYKLIKEYAAEKMAEMPISDATNVNKWRALEKRYERESIEALKKALDADLRYKQEESGLVPVQNTEGQAQQVGSGTQVATTETLPAKRRTPAARETVSELWQKANEAKLRQRIFAEYAALAQKNKTFVQKKNARLQARAKTIRKNNNIPANERYMYNHGLYVLGLSKQDAQKPQEAMSIMDMVKGYADSLQAFFVDEDGNITMPDYALSAMTGNTPYKDGYTGLTMEQYKYFFDMLSAIYKAGVDANKVKSMKDINGNTVLISDIAEQIVAETGERVPLIMRDDVTNAGSMTVLETIQDKARRARVDLTKPETVLQWMGPTAYRYIYETVNQSWNKERIMLEQTAEAVKAIWAPYTTQEKSEMRSKRQFRFGTSLLTREEMICVAFNWGTEINRKRVMDGYNVDERTVQELLSNLTQKDWQMVTSVWELVNSYWPETVRVEESMTGTAPEKQSAMPFEITGKDGNVYKLNGGYYPIKYDPSKSLKAANQSQDDAAKQAMANNAAMNRNRGFTKQRVNTVKNRPLLLSFNVLNKHLNDVIHNICFRESLRDVNRIIKHPDVSRAIQDHFGIPQARALEQWVRDCWAPDVQKKDAITASMEFFRHKQTAAVLGYRVTTAALNALNIYPMTDYLGAARTIEALQKFYSDPRANWQFALDRSIFLRQRAETMDRDAGEVLRKEFIGGYGTVVDTVIRGERFLESHAFEMLAFTDCLLACPLWTAEYQRVYQEMTAQMDANMTAADWQRIEMEAVAAGDKAVRTVFGSGETKDLAPVQKGTEMTKALTMFYSYFNVVFNALYSGYAQGRQQAMGTGGTIQVAPLLKKFVYWTILTGVTEGLMRFAIDAMAGGDDDPEELAKKMAKGVSDNIAGTIPVFRDMVSILLDKVMGERYFSARPLPAYGVLDTGMKFWNTVESDKKTKIDVFREGMRITNGFTGIGNTITDALATTAYWADTDFDTPFFQYLAAVIFDKRIDKKKKR